MFSDILCIFVINIIQYIYIHAPSISSMPCHMTHLLTLSIQVHVVGGFNPPVTHISHPISMLEHVLEGTHQPIAAYIIISLHHHLR